MRLQANESFCMKDLKSPLFIPQFWKVSFKSSSSSVKYLANRQSVAKREKIRYTGELEKKVHTLQNEATTLSAQATML
ncbi:hypothetical protein ISN45_Un23g000010 [Arabidopsis thaliana x Arabidopsis arenosa]|uniref:BZIP domain-containing protein n=1 Tax=Arabidopsis thaliana x Arabidopsis arenosa TaxID=1240361 RepID=A0A8T1XH48_9BRAS|nr:hypothetical protein ISN45_Un23g000010 [Arabidopsis thaliana x Arabidopsis arenosa]